MDPDPDPNDLTTSNGSMPGPERPESVSRVSESSGQDDQNIYTISGPDTGNLRQRRGVGTPGVDSANQSFRSPRKNVHDNLHIHAVSQNFESLDYEIIENELYKAEERSPGHQVVLWWESLNRWLVCFYIGVLTALVASFIDVVVYYSTHLKFLGIRKTFEFCRDLGSGNDTNCFAAPIATWWAFNMGFVAIASSLVVFFAGPVASGSGIPQIKCFLNGIMIPGAVRIKTLVAKAVGVGFSVAGGLSVGKEGPMIHSGAVIAAGVSQGRCISMPFDFGIYKYFRNDKDKRDFVSAGAAAGVAAAFGAPIGGVLFSLEEGASFWNQSLTWRIFFSSMISSFTLSLVLSTFYNKAGDFSWSGLANFGTFTSVEYEWWEIFFFLLMGAFGGLTGALFNHINYKLTLFRMHFLSARWQKFSEALIVAMVSGTAACMLIYTFEDCQPLSINQNMSTQPLQLWCHDGEYSATAEIFFRSPEEAVKSLFHAPPSSYRPITLTAFALLYFLLSTWTYGLQVPSGLFIPTLLVGAAWGRVCGIGMQHLFPNYAGLDPGKYALAGAAAQLGGVVRMTISLCAIIIEATHNITFGLPIMLILMMAKFVGDYFNEGLYDIHIEVAEVPLLGWDPPKLSANIPAKKVMNARVVVLRKRERVGRVYEILKQSEHHGFPVVSDYEIPDPDLEDIAPTPRSDPRTYGKLLGLIRRNQLITLLQHRYFTEDFDGSELVAGHKKITVQAFRDAYPKYNVQLDHITLSEADNECWMNLEPIMDPSPHRVPGSTSLSSIFQLFRGLGLRNLIVVDHSNNVIGMVTRKDIARFKEEQHGSKYHVREIYITDG